MGTTAYSNYVITSGRHAIATRSAASAREALLDYIGSLGCKREDIVSYGAETVAWRGAIYRAKLEDPAARTK